MKKIILINLCLYTNHSYSQDYFNPMFLGSDVDSIDDLSYLSAGNNVTPGNYLLNLIIGENSIGNINVKFAENEQKQVSACFTQEIVDLIPFNKATLSKINADTHHSECIDINAYVDGFSYEIDLSKLSMHLLIPQIYLTSIRSTLAKESDWDDGIVALMTNYNVNGSYTKNKNIDDYSSEFFSFNNRFNIGAWRFHSSFYYNQNRMGETSSHEWNTNNIFVSRNINAIKSTLTVGQSVLGSTLFDSNPFIGVSIATANEMLPDSSRGYSPEIKGIAESRSKLTIKQNGNILYQEYVNPGPYNIDNLNAVGSSGDYEVELTSEQGVVTKYTVPYSSLPNLLRQGSYNYAVALGQLDITQAEKSKFMQGSLGYGLPFDTTLYSGYQIADDYLAYGLGFAKNIGHLGALSLDSIQAKSKVNEKNYTGSSYRILYAKSFNETGTNLQLTGYRYSTSDYYTFSEANYKNSNTYDANDYVTQSRNARKKNSFQVNVSQNLGNYGQLYVWGNINSYWGNDNKSQNLQFGWNKSFTDYNNVVLSASYNKNTYRNITDNTFYLSLSMPLSNGIDKNKMYLTNSTNFNQSRHNNLTSLYGNALDNKLDYNIYQSFSNNTQDSSNLNFRYRADVAEFNAGTTLSSQSKEIDYGLTGSVLVHHGGVVFSRQLHDTAILVEAKGAAGAKLDKSGEDITVNRHGYALVPYATAYHYNDIALSPEAFGMGYDIDGQVLKSAPTRGAIGKVVFDVRKGYNFLVSLRYKNKPIKFGTLVNNKSENTTSIVNDDSTVYLTGVKSGTRYSAMIDKNTTCTFAINYDEKIKMKSINDISLDCK